MSADDFDRGTLTAREVEDRGRVSERRGVVATVYDELEERGRRRGPADANAQRATRLHRLRGVMEDGRDEQGIAARSGSRIGWSRVAVAPEGIHGHENERRRCHDGDSGHASVAARDRR